jgi:hypothetical protein
MSGSVQPSRGRDDAGDNFSSIISNTIEFNLNGSVPSMKLEIHNRMGALGNRGGFVYSSIAFN